MKDVRRTSRPSTMWPGIGTAMTLPLTPESSRLAILAVAVVRMVEKLWPRTKIGSV